MLNAKTLRLSAFLLLAFAIYFSIKLHGQSVKVSFEDVVHEARDLSKKNYIPHPAINQGPLADMQYDQAREIRFDKSRALWLEDGLPFRVEFFFSRLG